MSKEIIAFDQYQRYKNIELIVNSIRRDNQVFRILEVGANEHRNLEKFLKEDKITYLDMNVPDDLLNSGNYIQGDATNINLEDNSFDIVVAVDVFEHIFNDRKKDFIKELSRVSNILFIFCAPFKSKEVEFSEYSVNEIYKTIYEKDNIWLLEHKELGLPDLDHTLKILDEYKIKYSYFGHGDLISWEGLMNIHFKTIKDFNLIPYRKIIDRYYNDNLFSLEYSNKNVYRYFIVGTKDVSIDFSFLKKYKSPNKYEKNIKERYEHLEKLISEFRQLELYRTIVMTSQNKRQNKKMRLYIDENNGFYENNSLEFEYELNMKNIKLDLFLDRYIKNLRIDPIENECIVDINKIFLDGVNIEKLKVINGINLTKNIILFNKEDPQIIIEDVNKDNVSLALDMNVYSIDKNILDRFISLYSNLNNTVDEYKSYIEKVIEFKDIQIDKQQNEIRERDVQIDKQQNEIRERDIQIDKQQNEIREKDIQIDKQQNEIREKDIQIDKQKNEIRERDIQIDNINISIKNKENELYEYKKYLESTLVHVQKLEDIIKNKGIKNKIKKNFSNLNKAVSIVKENGFRAFVYKLRQRSINSQDYNKYMDIEKLDLKKIEEEINLWSKKPLISILMPVYNVDEKWLDIAINSVRKQVYKNWELCIVDDFSTNENTLNYLRNIRDDKIKVSFNNCNSGISETTNNAYRISSGEILCLMDNDDEISEDALYEIAKSFNNLDIDIAYSDEDKVDIKGKYSKPFFKPDWSPDLLMSQMYICHFLCFKREIFEKINGFKKDYDGSQDYDFMIRASEITDKIHHIPKILYSWRELPSSTSINPDSKPQSHISALKSLNSHLKRIYPNQKYEAFETDNMFVYDVRYFMKEKVLVSIIIPFKDKVELNRECVNSIINKTDYNEYEIILINNRSEKEETYSWIKDITKRDNIKVVDADCDFNWSAINNIGIKEAKGEVFIFLNNDTIVESSDWLERISENCIRQDVGVVGALLLYDDFTIQHAGVVIGLNGWADHIYKGTHPIHYGSPFVSPMVTRNVTAVTGACMGISRKTIEKIGLFDENFIICGSDVEMCIRALKNGLRNIYTPYAKLLHLESKSRDSFIPEIDFELSKLHYSYYWEKGDPYFNQNLDINSVVPKIK